MKKDFTSSAYVQLLESFQEAGYLLMSFSNYMEGETSGVDKVVILRHDVDRRPFNALQMARIESAMCVNATYYFRIVKESFDAEIIQRLASLGHEIGYHYEDLSLAKGRRQEAVELFQKHLRLLRRYYPVQTICMHGSPLSRWDNRLIWQEVDYRSFGIIGEPYFDLDYNEVFYLTDTGRRWNSSKYARRDKVSSRWSYALNSTWDVIDCVKANELPATILINTHPQRWEDGLAGWLREFVLQNLKNPVKRVLVLSSEHA